MECDLTSAMMSNFVGNNRQIEYKGIIVVHDVVTLAQSWPVVGVSVSVKTIINSSSSLQLRLR